MDLDDLAASLYDGLSLLSRRLRLLPAPGELSLPERAALSRLNRTGPTTAAELARAEQITAQAMGTTVNSLEDRGLVERHPDPNDGRRAVLTVSAAGQEMLRHKRNARTAQLAQVLDEQFTSAELKALTAAAPLLERLGSGL
ncbi:MarR family winged helix-turn-helix transcriptional regulator [Amycolatopsis jiangsuensis]|uniref:DNA-binding MarR family transcriptional regulator n=1 Tax=Amycolatopsis jiangsuensis TaxID=1181879 RepID=A0A840IZD5_9PSEU|nr:MarR family transcriptional regulator [Amycolatopsis jiangsuensis]MBB4686657.1 DNA-binding MarR family transcriptional regulator [Amycolatopsis jiangsuensis]